jgi:hypothetical protein
MVRAKQREEKIFSKGMEKYSREINTALSDKYIRILYDVFKRKKTNILTQLRIEII